MRKTLLLAALLTWSLAARADVPVASDILPPDTPSGIKVEKTFTTVKVSWDRIPRISSYTVEYSIKRYFIWNSTKRVENYQGTSFTLRYPYSLSRYTFHVYALAGPVSSPPSNGVTVVSPVFGGAEILAIFRLAA